MDKFTQAYIECALWSSTDDNDAPLDENYFPTDLSEQALARIKEDCTAFQRDNAELLGQAYQLYNHSSEWSHEEQAGHDFWLTRNRHGAGFWDRGLGEIGRKLTDAAHAYGECYIYVGDDGKLYI